MKKEKEGVSSSIASPKTMESRQMMIASLGWDLLEQHLRDGTATSQEICTAIKYGSERENAEIDKIKADGQLKKAQIESMQKAEASEETYQNAIEAMRSYRSTTP